MVRLLVRLKDNRRLGGKDADHYGRGDIVCVVPEGHDWGSVTTLPNWLRLEVQTTPEKVAKYVSEDAVDDGVRDGDGHPVLRRRARRVWRVLFDGVPAAVRQLVHQRDDGGRISPDDPHLVVGPTGDVTWQQFRAHVHDKVRDRTEEQDGTRL